MDRPTRRGWVLRWTEDETEFWSYSVKGRLVSPKVRDGVPITMGSYTVTVLQEELDLHEDLEALLAAKEALAREMLAPKVTEVWDG